MRRRSILKLGLGASALALYACALALYACPEGYVPPQQLEVENVHTFEVT